MGSKKDVYRARLSDVPEDKVFRCYDGDEFRTLEDLAKAISHMSDQTFLHHVSAQNNDFSNWVGDVIGDSSLANSLRKAPDRAQAYKVIKDRISWLKARI